MNMNCAFASLDPCEPEFACCDEEEIPTTRRHHFARRDVTKPKTREQRNARDSVGVDSNVLREPDSCRNYFDEDTITSMDDESSYYPPKRIRSKNAKRGSKRNDNKKSSNHNPKRNNTSPQANSYFSPKYIPSTVQENRTNSTCPSTATETSDNSISDQSQWTKTTKGNVDDSTTTSLPFSWMPGYYDTIVEEPEMTNVWSGDDDFSVGAVRTNTKAQQLAALAETQHTFSAFDYIRMATTGQRFSDPKKDPPSDKSMFTTYSIRAEDAGSALHRQALMRRQQKVDELARAIQKRKELAVQHVGTEP